MTIHELKMKLAEAPEAFDDFELVTDNGGTEVSVAEVYLDYDQEEKVRRISFGLTWR